MKFNEIEYRRPNLGEFEKEFNTALERFNNAESFEVQDTAMEQINSMRKDFETAMSVASVRHTIDTTDPFYEAEHDYFDQNSPLYSALVNKFYKALINAKFRDQLQKKWGSQLFTLAELAMKTFSEEVIKLLQKENSASSEYTKLIASAKIFFEGEERNLAGMAPFAQSPDRDMRKRANDTMWGWFAENAEKFDKIYDELVHTRHQIARQLGYENFVRMGYDRMQRSDYSPEMVARFRKQVLEVIVPAASKLRERQRRRLGLEKLLNYDEALNFNSGNPTPKGTPEWIVDNAKDMYRELSPETDKFFSVMVNNDLMDLVNKKGKAAGGYCTVFPKYGVPFIFSNFNGTAHDVDVLTHEAGHAFQCYESRTFGIPEYYFPTSEACEIHSMSMEFFAWPWMDNFFKEDVEKYKFQHLAGAILFIPYGVSVDEFQHFVYENPDASPDERKAKWREIEKKYLPHRDYAGNEFLEQGGFWQKQAHIYNSPFYYIDYTLAQICALQFWKRANQNREEAFADYLRLCQAGGSKPFLELVNLANLRSPFDEGTVRSIVAEIEEYLDSVDDTRF